MKRGLLIIFLLCFVFLISFSSAVTVTSSSINTTGSAIEISGEASAQSISASIIVISGERAVPWDQIMPPEGVFEPYNSSLVGTRVNNFSIRFVNITIGPTEMISCFINLSNGSIMNLSETGLSLTNENYTMNYTMNSSDPITDHPTNHYLPWILKNCTFTNSSGSYNQSTNNSRIYVHSPVYWDSSEVTRAIACRGTPGTYFNNTGKCEFAEDTLFALQMRNGNPVNETCFNNPGVACSDSYCNGIFFPTCDPIDYFGGYYAGIDDPNGYATFNVSFGGYTTPIAYTRYTNTSGNFKLRLTETLASKTFTITIYNLTNVSNATVYGNETGSGTTTFTPNGDGTFNVAHNRLGSPFTGTLDLTFNVSFDADLDENRSLYLILGYGVVGNDGDPAYFNATFNPSYGFKNNNESENTSAATDAGGRCGDEANNDFDYLNGIWQYSFDCFDLDCNNTQGDDSQTNEFGSGKTGVCNYQTEINCTDEFDNDYDYTSGTGYTDCHDSDCFQNDSACPAVELTCNDTLNNDWDYTLGETDFAASEKVDNNGTKYNSTYSSDLIDCEDPDCSGKIGGSVGQLCNWAYENNCSDNFDNDALQLKDCEISAVSGPTANITPAYAEYDCDSYCRQNNLSEETGSLCNDNLDNDWDAIFLSGYYTDEYSVNNTNGSGIDCRWGGYFSYGTNYNPDEDCNLTTLSNGYRCELGREINCTDSFDNDYDQYASSMPHAGWINDTSGYEAYFNQTFSNDTDFDDYDCQSHGLAPGNESLNSSWCFDNIDNDLDAYYWASVWVSNSSTGIDCNDTDCNNVVNPNNSEQSCSDYEYNSSVPGFNNPGKCSDTIDNDLDTTVDCADTDCFHQFGMCGIGECKAYENVTWDSCADSSDNDGGIGSDGTDCADTDCLGMVGDTSGALCEAAEVDCSDNFDNDADGSIDCNDSYCVDEIGGVINNTDVYCRASESTLSDCFDGFDNDADNSTDCYDYGCNTQCNLTTISGTTPLSLPTKDGQTSINSASDTYILDHTSRIKNGYWYNITLKDTSESTHAQWTLGSAVGGIFNKSKFNVSTAYLSGQDAADFGITETPNGFIVESTEDFPSGYELSFLIESVEELSSSTYELIWAEEAGEEQLSTENYIPYEIVENITPQAQSIEVIPSSGMLSYSSPVYLRANISDNNQLGLCDWYIYGTETHNPSNSTSCLGNFTPSQEGTYYINVTPVDYYSNIGTPIQETYQLNILPRGNTVTVDMMFLNTTNSSLVINSTFNVVATDTLGSCEIFAKNSTDEISLTSFAATGSICYGTADVSSLSEGVYSIYANVNETTDNNIIKGNETTFFVCNQVNDSICKYADFNNNNWPDSCPDSTAPNITLLTPVNDSTITSSNTITFTYNVTDNAGISYCELIINDTLVQTDYSITNGTQNSFIQNVNNGAYFWSVNCSDGPNLGESEKYNLTVSVQGGTGGGGGGGFPREQLPAFVISRKLIKTSVFSGGIKREYFTIRNNGSNKINTTLDIASISEFVSLSENNFELKPKETKNISVQITPKGNCEPDIYFGKILVQSGKVIEDIEIIIEVEPCKTLLDVEIEIPKQFLEVHPGDDFFFIIHMRKMSGEGMLDINLTYLVKNSKDQVILTKSESMAIETQSSHWGSFKVPKNTYAGTHVLFAEVRYGEDYASASTIFEVIEPKPGDPVVAFALSVILLAVAAVLSFLLYKKLIKKEKKKPYRTLPFHPTEKAFEKSRLIKKFFPHHS
ncbi:MAG: hypothetical protein JSW08_02690 [archaeon]|nr:MAG: hypothetical protein JSW08_02690 [archaeon]